MWQANRFALIDQKGKLKMAPQTDDVQSFVAELRKAVDVAANEAELLSHVGPLVQRMV